MSYPDEDHREYPPTQDQVFQSEACLLAIKQFEQTFMTTLTGFATMIGKEYDAHISAEDIADARAGLKDVLDNLFHEETMRRDEVLQKHYGANERQHQAIESRKVLEGI